MRGPKLSWREIYCTKISALREKCWKLFNYIFHLQFSETNVSKIDIRVGEKRALIILKEGVHLDYSCNWLCWGRGPVAGGGPA